MWNNPGCKNSHFTSVWRIETSSGSFSCENELSKSDFSSQNSEDLSVTGAAPRMETLLISPASFSEPWTEVAGANGQYPAPRTETHNEISAPRTQKGFSAGSY